jgi:hypothetical protein
MLLESCGGICYLSAEQVESEFRPLLISTGGITQMARRCSKILLIRVLIRVPQVVGTHLPVCPLALHELGLHAFHCRLRCSDICVLFFCQTGGLAVYNNLAAAKQWDLERTCC